MYVPVLTLIWRFVTIIIIAKHKHVIIWNLIYFYKANTTHFSRIHFGSNSINNNH